MFTYQQDTTKAANPLRNLPGEPATGGLNINRAAPVPLGPIPERQTTETDSGSNVSRSAPAPPTATQLRYRWWQREQSLLVEGSRYMEPRTEAKVSAATITKNEGFRLPARTVNRENYDWLTILLLLILVLLASVRTFWGKYLGHLFHSVLNYSTSLRLFQDKNTALLQGTFQLDILFYLVFSIFVFQLFQFFRIDLPWKNFSLFLFSLVLVLIYFLAKKALYRLMAFINEKNHETGEYLFNMNNINRVTGLLLFPVVTVIAFYPFSNIRYPVITGLITVLFLYFLLLSRGLIILLRKQFSIFYLFLYFCTLEILPLVLLYKILVV